MDVRELRIGNLIEWNKQPFKVCRIFTDSIENEFWCKPLNELHPIPLTEEWLVKLGFEESYNSSVRLKFDHKENTECGYDFSRVSDKSMEGFRYYGHYIKIGFVHQLQNLYYSLTGKELETI